MKAFGSVFLFLLAVASVVFVYFTPMGKELLQRKEKVIMLGDNDPEFDKVVAQTTGAAPETPSVTEIETATVAVPVAQAPAPEEDSAFFAEAAPEKSDSSSVEFGAATPSEPVAATQPPKPVADLTLEEIARQPKVWPMHVTLKKDHNFPIVMDGRTIGSAKVTAGSRVKVIAVHLEGMNVDFNGNRINVPAEDTDLLALVNKASGNEDQTIIASQGQ